MPFSSFAMASHAPLFLRLLIGLIGKFSLHISRRNLVSASDQFGHRFLIADPSLGLFSLLLLALEEDAGEGPGEGDVPSEDAAGINCRVAGLKCWYCGFCKPAP